MWNERGIDMAFCKYCGHKLESDAVFCAGCGKKLAVKSNQQLTRKDKQPSKAMEGVGFCKFCGKPTTLGDICADCLTSDKHFNRPNSNNSTTEYIMKVLSKSDTLTSEEIKYFE